MRDIPKKNTRHCVNSISLEFVPAQVAQGSAETAYFAGGCFWGVEYYLEQAPGVGDQYRSEIFYRSVEQQEIAEKLVNILEKKGFNVATRIRPARVYWKAEEYHQGWPGFIGRTDTCSLKAAEQKGKHWSKPKKT